MNSGTSGLAAKGASGNPHMTQLLDDETRVGYAEEYLAIWRDEASLLHLDDGVFPTNVVKPHLFKFLHTLAPRHIEARNRLGRARTWEDFSQVVGEFRTMVGSGGGGEGGGEAGGGSVGSSDGCDGSADGADGSAAGRPSWYRRHWGRDTANPGRH